MMKDACISYMTGETEKLFIKHVLRFKVGGDIDVLSWGWKDGGGAEFTQEEIDYIKRIYKTDLADFGIIEVEE